MSSSVAGALLAAGHSTVYGNHGAPACMAKHSNPAFSDTQ